MKDPITASDGFSYDKIPMEKWRDQCKKEGKPFISPNTGLPLVSDELKPNAELKALSEKLFELVGGPEADDGLSKFMLSSNIFKEFERIESLDILNKLKLRSLQIVVLGREKDGKSTALERIIGFPIFPKDKKV